MSDDSRPQDDTDPGPAEGETQPNGETSGVVVLGMSRSGTSAVSEAFARSGFFAGREPDLMPPTASNPRGYWENYAVYRANEAVLGELGGSWFDPPTPERMKAARHLRDALGSALDHVIQTAVPAPVVIKDPRIGVLLDLWGPLLEGRLHPVLVVRPPTEVAASLATRDGTPRTLGLAGWEVHVTRLLDYLRGRTVTVAPYAGLLADPAQASMIVNAAASHLDPGRQALVDASAAPAVMIADLRRHRPDPGELDDCLTATQARLWRFLDDLPPGDQVIELPSDFTGRPPDAALEAVRDETRRLADKTLARDVGIRLDAVDGERRRFAAERDSVAVDRDSIALDRDATAVDRDSIALDRDRIADDRDSIALDRDRIADDLAAERALAAELRAELGRAVYQVDERARHRAEHDAMATQRDAIALERDAIAAERDSIKAAHDALALEQDALALERDALALERDALTAAHGTLAADRDAVADEPDANRRHAGGR